MKKVRCPNCDRGIVPERLTDHLAEKHGITNGKRKHIVLVAFTVEIPEEMDRTEAEKIVTEYLPEMRSQFIVKVDRDGEAYRHARAR